jgi:hypothetical protein
VDNEKSIRDQACPDEQGKRTKFLASKHTTKKPIVAGCSELFLFDTHFGFLSL